jgi:hypothetical protein
MMIVGDSRINFNLRLVWQLTPTINRGMGVGETGANTGASDGTARHPRSKPWVKLNFAMSSAKQDTPNMFGTYVDHNTL